MGKRISQGHWMSYVVTCSRQKIWHSILTANFRWLSLHLQRVPATSNTSHCHLQQSSAETLTFLQFEWQNLPHQIYHQTRITPRRTSRSRCPSKLAWLLRPVRYQSSKSVLIMTYLMSFDQVHWSCKRRVIDRVRLPHFKTHFTSHFVNFFYYFQQKNVAHLHKFICRDTVIILSS